MARPQRRVRRFDSRRRRKVSILTKEKVDYIDYKDVTLLRRFISDRAKIRPRRVTGNNEQQQKAVALAIKNAREMALLPYENRITTQRRNSERRNFEPENVAESSASSTSIAGGPARTPASSIPAPPRATSAEVEEIALDADNAAESATEESETDTSTAETGTSEKSATEISPSDADAETAEGEVEDSSEESATEEVLTERAAEASSADDVSVEEEQQ